MINKIIGLHNRFQAYLRSKKPIEWWLYRRGIWKPTSYHPYWTIRDYRLYRFNPLKLRPNSWGTTSIERSVNEIWSYESSSFLRVFMSYVLVSIFIKRTKIRVDPNKSKEEIQAETDRLLSAYTYRKPSEPIGEVKITKIN